jgi:cellulose synthase/poly-beta-1,6-N-acetylglucosamine synthase-like glycosyltransferase
MLANFLAPMILRPLDFCQNYFGYIVGFLTYFVMLPVFINVMQIYSMCNLHDLSWGNRPAAADAAGATGMASVAANRKK